MIIDQGDPHPVAPSKAAVEELWSNLEQTLTRLFNLTEDVSTWFSPSFYIKTYTQAYEFCTLKREPRPNTPYHLAYFYGDELYGKLKNFIHDLLRNLGQVHYGERSLDYFMNIYYRI